MRPVFVLLALLILSGCDAPGPEFAGLPAQRLLVGQSVFDVRLKGDIAQAIRLNSEWAPRPEAVWPRAFIAIEEASGCKVRRMEGDQVVIIARLACKGSGPALSRPSAYRCELSVLNDYTADVLCEPGL